MRHNFSTQFLPDDDLTLTFNSSTLDDSLVYSVSPENFTDLSALWNSSLLNNDTMTSEGAEEENRATFYIIVYTVFILLSILLTPARSIFFYKIFMNASRGLHNRMFQNVLAAPMRFFETNPSGKYTLFSYLA